MDFVTHRRERLVSQQTNPLFLRTKQARVYSYEEAYATFNSVQAESVGIGSPRRGDAIIRGLRIFVTLFYFRAKLVPNPCCECSNLAAI